MPTTQRNAMLLAAVVAGLLSLPTAWMTIRSSNVQITPQIGGRVFTPGTDFSNLFATAVNHSHFDVTGLNGYVTLLLKLPIWLIVALAITASVFQLANNFSSVDFPPVILWSIALFAFVWTLLPVVIGIASDHATPGIGWLLGIICATIPLATLWLGRSVRSVDGSRHPAAM